MVESKCVTELLECKTHAVCICKQEVVFDLVYAVPENDVTICEICLVKRQENVKMVGAFGVVTGDEISGLEQLFPERNAVFGRIDNFHILAVSVGVELDVGIVDRQAEVGL